MITAHRPDLNGLPGLPQLKGLGARASNAELEREFGRAHLLASRTIIRLACAIATIVALTRGLELFIGEARPGIASFNLTLVIVASASLAMIAFSPVFEKMYRPWARIIVPARNVIIAAHVAHAAANGSTEMLIVLPLMLVGPFFFLGLSFRTAFIAGVLTLVSFGTSALLFDLSTPITMRAAVFLSMGLIGCSIAARHVHQRSRASFIETQKILELAQQDPLTGIKNRRVFDQQLADLWSQSIEENRSLAILLLDIDHFKSYNDRYGHQAGDEALRQVADAIKTAVVRPPSVLARYGGEEFAAVIQDADVRQARAIAECMRRAVEQLAIEHRGSPSRRVTISVGVALIKPDRDRQWEGGLQLADQALYDAKAKGRNRVESMDEAQHQLLITGAFTTSAAGRATAC
jgi:diguanylate cyclase (GGDEF)-like protein